MNYVDSLVKAVEKRNYDETVKNIQKVCEEVLGYEKIAECSPEDGIDSVKDELALHAETVIMEIIPQIPPEIVDQIPLDQIEVIKAGIRPEIEVIEMVTTDRCYHYANSSRKKPEGIITKLFYERINDNFKLGWRMQPNTLPITVFGYGEKWLDNGEITPVDPCHKSNLQIPEDIYIFSDMNFENFVETIKK